MRLPFTIGLFIITTNCFAQIKTVYSYDFDYRFVGPKDSFAPSIQMPNYYIISTFKDNKLTDIDIFQKQYWMKKHLRTHAYIKQENGITYFIYNGGKTKTGNRAVIPSKTKYAYLAMLKNDTLIFKNISPNSVHIDYAYSIFSDSIYIDKKTFDLNKHTKHLFAYFSNYTDWNTIDGHNRYYQAILTPNKENVIRYKRMIDDGYTNYSFSDKYHQSFFKDLKMPVSFFWIKHTGLIY